MNPGFAPFFLPRRETDYTLRGEAVQLRLPPTSELLAARAEQTQLENGAEDSPLCANACLLSRALYRHGAPLFSSGQAVLEALSPAEIQEAALRVSQLSRSLDPGVTAPEPDTEGYLAALRRDSAGRLRWKVQRALQLPPSDPRLASMTERDYLYCVLQMILDEEEALDSLCPACRERAEQRVCRCCGTSLAPTEVNGEFDPARFRQLAKAVIDRD